MQPEERERLRRLAAFAERFREPGASFGTFPGDEPPYFSPAFEPSKLCSDFESMAYDSGWVLRGFDWSEWVWGPEGQRLMYDPRALASATSDQLAKLLVTCIRQERFVDGGLTHKFETGLLLAIAERAGALLREDGEPKEISQTNILG